MGKRTPEGLTLAAFKAALREAFEAGVEQGSDEATAYDWGSHPRQTREAAFADLFEEWNRTDAKAILAVAALLAAGEREAGDAEGGR